MSDIFVDTSGFYAVLDATDPFHADALAAFRRAIAESATLRTTSYVLHESWALIQHRLGWDAVDDFLNRLAPRCQVKYVDQTLHAQGAAECRRRRQRGLSLTDCVSFEFMRANGLRYFIGRDAHFQLEGFLPAPQ